jgi:hypothetical protein
MERKSLLQTKSLLQITAMGLLAAGGLVSILSSGTERKPEEPTIQTTSKQKVEEERFGYDYRFDLTSIRSLQKDGISADVANQYDLRFSVLEIKDFVFRGIDAKTVHLYASRKGISGYDISDFVKAGIKPELLRKYHWDLDASEIKSLIGLKISPETYDKIHEEEFGTLKQGWRDRHFFSQEVIQLAKSGVKPEEVLNYSRTFSVQGVMLLIRNGIKPENANQYGKLNQDYSTSIDGEDVVNYTTRGIPFKVVEQKAREVWLDKSIRK